MDLDHVAFAWARLEPVVDAAGAVGLPTAYGGRHADGATEMALVPLADGTYLELIAGTGDGEPGYWPGHVAASAGPADWCLRVERVGDELQRAIDAGIPVRGPVTGGRERPDGRRLEWDVGWLEAPGLPFVIADRTPRAWRVRPGVGGDGERRNGSDSDGDEDGDGDDLDARLAEVVVAVADVDAASRRLRRCYGLPGPDRGEAAALAGASTLASFPGAPVTLAAPASGTDLADRLDRLGPGPVAYLLAGPGTAALSTGEPVGWLDGSDGSSRTVRWLDAAPFAERVGVVG